MRRLALVLLTLLATPLLMGGGIPAPPRQLDLSDADAAELDAISAYLNGIGTLKGGFIQIESSGNVSQGSFYISKPGKMRFVYNPPSPTLVVVDGHTVAVANMRLNTVDRYPLSETPLGLVVGNDIDLRHDRSLLSIQHAGGSLILGMRTNNTMSRANISLVFSEPDYELRQWSVIDNQGLTTTVALRSVTAGESLSPSLFQLPERNPFARHGQD